MDSNYNLQDKDRVAMLRCMLDIGELLLISGAEIYRVEDTINRIGDAYGIASTDILAITENINLAIIFPDGENLCGNRRITTSASNDFVKICLLNELSRKICKNPIPVEDLEANIRSIRETKQEPYVLYVGNFLIAFGFALYFGGNVYDALVSSFCGLLIAIMQKKLQPVCPNNVTFSFLSSFITGFIICAFVNAFDLHRDMIMIGDIMLLIPGFAITISLRDILVGDTLSGILRLIESILIAGAIAGGFMLAMVMCGV